MFFYRLVIGIATFILYLFNGKPYVEGLENVPDNRNVILAGTHRSNWDPFVVAMTIKPKKVIYMAKESLFEIPVFGWMMRQANMIPVNRDNPCRKSIKAAVEVLNEGEFNFGIFPSGTRHSTEIKGGTAFIQRMSKKDIVPITIQPAIGFKEFFGRKKMKIAFGEPIKYQVDEKYDKKKITEVDQEIAHAFDKLDQQLDPSYTYEPAVYQK